MARAASKAKHKDDAADALVYVSNVVGNAGSSHKHEWEPTEKEEKTKEEIMQEREEEVRKRELEKMAGIKDDEI